MIILSNSIPKTGSTLLANYQEDILGVSKVKSGQAALRSSFNGRFIENPLIHLLFNLSRIESKHGSVVVKCHWRPSLYLDLYCRFQNVRMTMMYRDPRDMILSMIDHGNRSRKSKDPSGGFRDCVDVFQLIPRTVKFMKRQQYFESKDYVHNVKYEDMMSDPLTVLQKMVAFLEWKVKDESLKEIIELRDKSKKTSWNFNKGTTQRWKDEMNQEEKDACLEAFEPHLRRLNYSLT
jgi:hypothetical protein